MSVPPALTRTCKAKNPTTCPYHGAVIRMAEAVQENNPAKYLQAKSEAEKNISHKEKASWLPVPVFIKETELEYRQKILQLIDNKHVKQVEENIKAEEEAKEKKFAEDKPFNTVYKNGDRFQVKTRSPWGGEDVAITDVSDLTSPEDVQKLVEKDYKLMFQNGDCGVLAAELWNTNPHVEEYYYFKTEEDPDFGIHQFVKLKDGTYADSLGIWSEKHFLESWKRVDPTVTFSILPNKDNIKKDPKTKIAHPPLFDLITEIIDNHMNKK
jgi:hypothetical protein